MNKEEKSKVISYALRHKPEEFGLEPDIEGWVDFEDLYLGLVAHDNEFLNFTLEDIIQINSTFKKSRFEIKGDRVRAAYGHSFKTNVQYPSSTPPAMLYHGTTEVAFDIIKKEGIKPMSRQYVHLTEDKEVAILTAKRYRKGVVVLEIDTARMLQDGLEFYNPGKHIWLCKFVDPEYIKYNPILF